MEYGGATPPKLAVDEHLVVTSHNPSVSFTSYHPLLLTMFSCYQCALSSCYVLSIISFYDLLLLPQKLDSSRSQDDHGL